MTAKHTPTPWAADGPTVYSEALQLSLAKMCQYRGHCPDHDAEVEANAAFIVRACNAHDELVAAARELVDYINKTADAKSLRVKTAQDIPGFFPAVGKLEAAIARAELA